MQGGRHALRRRATGPPRVDYWSIWQRAQPGRLADAAVGARRGGRWVEAAPRIYRDARPHRRGRRCRDRPRRRTRSSSARPAPKGLKENRGETRSIDALRFVRRLYCLDDNLQRADRHRGAEPRGCPQTDPVASSPQQNPALFQATGCAHHPYELLLRRPTAGQAGRTGSRSPTSATSRRRCAASTPATTEPRRRRAALPDRVRLPDQPARPARRHARPAGRVPQPRRVHRLRATATSDARPVPARRRRARPAVHVPDAVAAGMADASRAGLHAPDRQAQARLPGVRDAAAHQDAAACAAAAASRSCSACCAAPSASTRPRVRRLQCAARAAPRAGARAGTLRVAGARAATSTRASRSPRSRASCGCAGSNGRARRSRVAPAARDRSFADARAASARSRRAAARRASTSSAGRRAGAALRARR